MLGMNRSNAGFALGCFGPCAAPAVVLALLGFARLQRGSTALDTSATAMGSTTETLDSPTTNGEFSCCQVNAS